MKLKINGKDENIDVKTVKDVIDEKELKKKGLIIEHNGKIIKQEDWSDLKLNDGDQLELFRFVGGG
ncbi:MAG TPA: sulfur carrier protein ThiS [bacterium]|nr:sulfur carrier protein ThiS [bacterium]